MAEEDGRVGEEEEEEEEGVLDDLMGQISDEEEEENGDEPPTQGPASHGSDSGRRLRRGSSSRNMDKTQEARDGGDDANDVEDGNRSEGADRGQDFDDGANHKVEDGQERYGAPPHDNERDVRDQNVDWKEDRHEDSRQARDSSGEARHDFPDQRERFGESDGRNPQGAPRTKCRHRVFVTGKSGGGEWRDRALLQKHFGKFGTILDVFVPKQRRVAYISFEEEQVLEDVLALEQIRIDNCWLRLIRADPRPADVATGTDRGLVRNQRSDAPAAPFRADGPRDDGPHMAGRGPSPHFDDRRDGYRPKEPSRDGDYSRDGQGLTRRPDSFRDGPRDAPPPRGGPGAYDGPRERSPFRDGQRSPFRDGQRSPFRDGPRERSPFRGDRDGRDDRSPYRPGDQGRAPPRIEGPYRGEHRDAPRDGPHDMPRDGPRDAPRDGFRDGPRDGPRDVRDGPRDGPRDAFRDGPRDSFRDGPRDGRDGFRDGPRDPPRDGPRDGFRDGPRDPPREAPREGPRELARDAPVDRGDYRDGPAHRDGPPPRESRPDAPAHDRDSRSRDADRPMDGQHDRGIGKRDRENTSTAPPVEQTGVGMVLDHPDSTSYGCCRVKEIKAGTPVGTSGHVMVGDMLLSVNSFNCVGVSRDVIKGHVLGPPNSPIDLEFQRGSAPPFVINIFRSPAVTREASAAAPQNNEGRPSDIRGRDDAPDSKRPRLEDASEYGRSKDDWSANRGPGADRGGFAGDRQGPEWESSQAARAPPPRTPASERLGWGDRQADRAPAGDRLPDRGDPDGGRFSDRNGDRFGDRGAVGDRDAGQRPGDRGGANDRFAQDRGRERAGNGFERGGQWGRDGGMHRDAPDRTGGYGSLQGVGQNGGWRDDGGRGGNEPFQDGGRGPRPVGWRDRSRSRSPPPQEQNVSKARLNDNRMFVTGTAGGHSWLQQDLIRRAVARFGPVLQVFIPRDRGFAYVSFEHASSLDEALRVQNMQIGECTVKMLQAKRQEQPRDHTGGDHGGFHVRR